jgi:hypothetical protein
LLTDFLARRRGDFSREVDLDDELDRLPPHMLSKNKSNAEVKRRQLSDKLTGRRSVTASIGDQQAVMAARQDLHRLLTTLGPLSSTGVASTTIQVPHPDPDYPASSFQQSADLFRTLVQALSEHIIKVQFTETLSAIGFDGCVQMEVERERMTKRILALETRVGALGDLSRLQANVCG